MPIDSNCIFCQIVAGRIPCFKIFEDDLVLAFLDIGPLVRGHTLVIPKPHFATVMETPAELYGAVQQRVPRIARALLAATGATACHVLVNNGADAQQSVGHLHVHILPRPGGEAFHIPWKAGVLDPNAGAALAAAAARALV